MVMEMLEPDLDAIRACFPGFAPFPLRRTTVPWTLHLGQWSQLHGRMRSAPTFRHVRSLSLGITTRRTDLGGVLERLYGDIELLA